MLHRAELKNSGRKRVTKGDDIKIKRKVSPFFLLPPVYLPFIAVLSLFLPFYIAKTLRSSEMKVKYG